ncbi:MAG: hypothetical protein LKJ13_03890 [Clostridia bacterium]|jgi:hypothetical protein|nr:hypothetical protein [Clostridia bacterium]MCI2000191.1 hypothetical protein [Clostridia bacterium]MCI2014644.1 hypothetical protein [Clostridia bacterium]
MISKHKKIIILAVFILSYFSACEIIYIKNCSDFKRSVLKLKDEKVTLNDITSFSWDSVYSFDPYESKEEIEKETGIKSLHLRESVSEDMTNIVFVKGKKVVCAVYGYPKNIGFNMSFYGIGSNCINSSKNAVFIVEEKNGVKYMYLSD